MHLPVLFSSSSVLSPKLKVSLKSVYETFLGNEHSKSMTSKIHLAISQGKSLSFVDTLSFKWKFMLNPTQ